MKSVIRVVAVVILLILAHQVQGQVNSNLTSIIDSVIVKAKTAAINSPSVQWDTVRAQMFRAAAYANSVQELNVSFQILLTSLKDKRGVFYDATNNTRIAGYPGIQPASRVNVLTTANGAKFDYRILENDVRYIRLVAIPLGSDGQKESELIRAAVDSLSKEEAPLWIVDLRYAVGGDMNPLFAGVGQLLDEGLVASTINGKSEIDNMYTVHNGNFYHNQVPVARFPTSMKNMRGSKIAVLTSAYTTGASEILALAFNGRKNTRLFGETTAGEITIMKTINLPNDLRMSIAEKMYTDRRGTNYETTVDPDVTVEFVPNVDINQDRAIAEASLWLTTTPVSITSGKITMN